MVNNGGRNMRNQKLHYLGIWLIFIGVIVTSYGAYMGSAPQFHNTMAEYSSTIMTGIVILIIGGLMWLFFEE